MLLVVELKDTLDKWYWYNHNSVTLAICQTTSLLSFFIVSRVLQKLRNVSSFNSVESNKRSCSKLRQKSSCVKRTAWSRNQVLSAPEVNKLREYQAASEGEDPSLWWWLPIAVAAPCEGKWPSSSPWQSYQTPWTAGWWEGSGGNESSAPMSSTLPCPETCIVMFTNITTDLYCQPGQVSPGKREPHPGLKLGSLLWAKHATSVRLHPQLCSDGCTISWSERQLRRSGWTGGMRGLMRKLHLSKSSFQLAPWVPDQWMGNLDDFSSNQLIPANCSGCAGEPAQIESHYFLR